VSQLHYWAVVIGVIRVVVGLVMPPFIDRQGQTPPTLNHDHRHDGGIKRGQEWAVSAHGDGYGLIVVNRQQETE
jgi:hypothetical protein